MNRLSTRLLVSHAAVAVVGGLTAYLVVLALAPQLYDMRAGRMTGPMSHGGALRAAAVDAMNGAVLVGVLAGIVTAAVAGAWSARRIMRPLADVRAATHRLIEGSYEGQLELPREQEVAAVVADVNALTRRLAGSEERRTHLLGEVAHEMRTPLTVLDGYVEGLIDGVFEPDAATMAELAGELRRLRRLSDDLGALSRAEERGVELRLAVTDLGEVAAGAAERLRPQFDHVGVRLDVVPTGGPAIVTGDADRLAQVVTNLVGNALAATPKGGMVRVMTVATVDEVVTEVADTGSGIATQDVGRVFERFYRIPSDDSERTRTGIGIGLTIARAIAAAHGGSIDVTSPGRGHGSTFRLRIPAGGQRSSGGHAVRP
ncbi:cell wall metabolism sensor histidine kinase WalK [Actinotalea sp. K2]|uniref:sensor histidine kinase n=1 Tax=Actinotalea sp. K2 TaxID=2939438 RepID=UPI00201716E6|nr:HAMP domain-containing sensor histidine kinase [Actinotalea sp. K2]MCL3862285.1 HAMP domain-containing histidine kinase [Actinotalea sp. K2]